MKIGMLWFDNDPKADLATKIQRAVTYYQGKYGDRPNLCYANPSTVREGQLIEHVTVMPNRSVLPNHFWIGVADDNNP